jgi:MFS family permease
MDTIFPGAIEMELAKNLGAGKVNMQLLLRAFRYRNYRLYFAGQGFSLLGTWMQTTALSWLVYRMTGSAMLLGVTGFVSQLPALLFTPFGGVLADRLDRRRLLLWTQVLAMFQATALAALVLAGVIAVWHIIALSFMLGLVNAFDVPARHSFLAEMIEDREDIGNAVALNSTMFHGSRLVGPALAGVLISAFGEGVCFAVNALSYLAVIAALAAMKIKSVERRHSGNAVRSELGEGLKYALASAPIRNVLLLVGLVSLAGMPYIVLMPVIARDILGGGPGTLGLLMATSGFGAFAGTIFLASRRDTAAFGKVIYGAVILFFAGIFAFAMSRSLWFSLLCLFVAGFGIVSQVAAGNAILQTIVDEDKRGRIMSLFNLAFLGMAPFGNLIAGGLASGIGVPATLIVCSVVCLAGSLRFAGRLRLQGVTTGGGGLWR